MSTPRRNLKSRQVLERILVSNDEDDNSSSPSSSIINSTPSSTPSPPVANVDQEQQRERDDGEVDMISESDPSSLSPIDGIGHLDSSSEDDVAESIDTGEADSGLTTPQKDDIIEKLILELRRARQHNNRLEKLYLNTDQHGKNSKKTERTLSVPIECATAVHSCYNKLAENEEFQGFDTSDGSSKNSNQNRDLQKQLLFEVRAQNGKNKWPKAVIEKACLRYFKSKRDDDTRRRKGKLESHRRRTKRRARMERKRWRRSAALEKCPWTPRTKDKVKQVINKIEFHSSEESADENGETRRYRRKLQWERTQLRKYKKELDDKYKQMCSVNSRRQLITIFNSTFTSDRSPPQESPKWAVKSTYM
ncbi:uncharacterized protein [Ptychodera flava]|uniref:uncharacterized protein n=1 Tax=Ptychodera flava TaxID=63121 RepID=UPI003969E92A